MFGPGGPSLEDLVREGFMSTVAGYDHLAPRFDTTPFRTPDSLLDEIAAYLGQGPRIGKLLDLCCGTGAVLKRLAPLYDEGVGVDFSPGMLAQAAQIAPPDGTTIRTIQADVLGWVPDDKYDVVTCFGAFGHILVPDQPKFLAMVRQALRLGGKFVFVTSPRPSPMQWSFWAAHGFNAAMVMRNAVVKPPFVMYYLTFPLEEALERCAAAGLEPRVTELLWKPRPDLVLVEAFRTT
jgi:SAM-dependent methyltransferase